jgi:hypothetical protein
MRQDRPGQCHRSEAGPAPNWLRQHTCTPSQRGPTQAARPIVAVACAAAARAAPGASRRPSTGGCGTGITMGAKLDFCHAPPTPAFVSGRASYTRSGVHRRGAQLLFRGHNRWARSALGLLDVDTSVSHTMPSSHKV